MNFFKKNSTLKKFIFTKKSSGGRNNSGKMTVRNRFLGHKKKYKILDFFRSIRDIPCKVRRLEYDCNRNTYIALVCYKNSILSYILSYDGIKLNDYILSSNDKKINVIKSGYSHLIINGVIGSFIYSLEYFPNFGAKIARAAGTFCQILKRYNNNYILVKLKSKEIRLFHNNVFFSYGIVLNKNKKFVKLYKASQNLFKGFKPNVRGEAKNSVDHPHGGNTSGGRFPVSFTGKLTKGVNTRLSRKTSNNLIYKSKHKMS